MEKIIEWANAIKIWEGNAPWLNNPGSLKFSSLTNSWGARPGVQASDGGYIAKFDTYEKGFDALCNFLILGCQDHLLSFHNARTLGEFTKVYAGNPPQSYINGIAHILGVPLDTNISTFLITDLSIITTPQAPISPVVESKPMDVPVVPTTQTPPTFWQVLLQFILTFFHKS